MTQTDKFYYVVGGIITDPVEVYVDGFLIAYAPFLRPSRVGDTFVGENSDDAFLVTISIYRLHEDTPPSPGDTYRLVFGDPAVVGDHVERTNTWEQDDPEAIRADYAQIALEQIYEYTNAEVAEDNTLKWATDLSIRNKDQVLSDLAKTDDADLGAFDPLFAAHPVSNPSYAVNLVRQEVEVLVQDDQLIAAGAEPLLSATERTAVETRIAANSLTARGQSTDIDLPEIGAPRSFVTVAGEKTEKAFFEEVTFDWAATTYYIPQVRFQTLPPGVNTAQIFAMVYDQDNVYRSWMPFVQQPDGSWATPSDVSYISIGKTVSSTWRVAIAYLGTSADYEITRRVVLVPPDIASSIIRWTL